MSCLTWWLLWGVFVSQYKAAITSSSTTLLPRAVQRKTAYASETGIKWQGKTFIFQDPLGPHGRRRFLFSLCKQLLR